jgi:RHS repeat-associated protein
MIWEQKHHFMLQSLRICAALLAICHSFPAIAGRDVTYYYTDPQGTVLATADSNGVITSVSDFRPFGDQVLGAPDNGVGFAGHMSDGDVALIYMQQRYYDPEVGRFLSVDPLTTDEAGEYTYAELNPFRFVDPDGRDSQSTPEACDIECKRAREVQRKRDSDSPYTGGLGQSTRIMVLGDRPHTGFGPMGVPSTAHVTKDGLTIVTGTGPGAKVYLSPDGRIFYAPEYADFTAVYNAGKEAGRDPMAMGSALGHFGKFDYQRVDAGIMGKAFYPAYTNASNFAVGVYAYGAGYSLFQTQVIGTAYSVLKSSNPGDPAQSSFWEQGWRAARDGHLDAPSH